MIVGEGVSLLYAGSYHFRHTIFARTLVGGGGGVYTRTSVDFQE